ncbi:MAG: hypothetical protein OHK0046_06700 [Anaerolineae bacterium]
MRPNDDGILPDTNPVEAIHNAGNERFAKRRQHGVGTIIDQAAAVVWAGNCENNGMFYHMNPCVFRKN